MEGRPFFFRRSVMPERETFGSRLRLQAAQFRAITSLTLVEIIRQPLCLLLTASAVFLMGLASLQAYQFGEDGRIARDSALAIHFVFGMLVGCYAAHIALGGEMKSGACSVVLSKPVSRDLFFMAKFAAVAAMVLIFSACSIPAVLLCEKAAPKLYHIDWTAAGCLLVSPVAAMACAGILNAWKGRPFASTAFWIILALVAGSLAVSAALYDPASAKRLIDGRLFVSKNAFQWRLVPVALLATLAIMVLAAAALTLTTRFGAPPVLALCILLLFGGLLSEYFFMNSRGGVSVAFRLIPNWQNFWMNDALSAGGRVPWRYVCAAAFQAFLFIAAALAAGVYLFRNTDVSRGD